MDRELVEAQKKWIENSRNITNINTLEAQRQWINKTITERQFAEKLLKQTDESVTLNDYKLIGASPNLGESSKEIQQKAYLLPTTESSLKNDNPINERGNLEYLKLKAMLNNHQEKELAVPTSRERKKVQIEKKLCERKSAIRRSFSPKKSLSRDELIQGEKRNIHVNKIGATKGDNFTDKKTTISSCPRIKVCKNPPIGVRKEEEKNSDLMNDILHTDKEKNDIAKCHNKDEMRKYIKQKQKERHEKLVQEIKLKKKEQSEKMKKLEDIKHTQKKIIESSKVRTQPKHNEKPQWVGPMEKTSMSTRSNEIKSGPFKLPLFSTGAIVFKKNGASNDLVETKSVPPKLCETTFKFTDVAVPKHSEISHTSEKLRDKSIIQTNEQNIDTPVSMCLSNNSQQERQKPEETKSPSNLSLERNGFQTVEISNENERLTFKNASSDEKISICDLDEKTIYQSNRNTLTSFSKKLVEVMSQTSPLNTEHISNYDLSLNVQNLSKLNLMRNVSPCNRISQNDIFPGLPSNENENHSRSRKRSSKGEEILNAPNIETPKLSTDFCSRKRRSSKGEEIINAPNIETSNLPTDFCHPHGSKKICRLSKCLDCIEHSNRKTRPRNIPYSCDPMELVKLLQTYDENHYNYNKISENNLEFVARGTRLEIPFSASSYQSETVHSFEFNVTHRNQQGSNIDLIEDEKFRSTIESMTLIPPATYSLTADSESISSSKSNEDSRKKSSNEIVIPDLSKVNTRRSTASSTDDTTISESLSVDPLRLSASIENLNLVTNMFTKTEDNFMNKCNSYNSNISQLIENLPISNKDHELSNDPSKRNITIRDNGRKFESQKSNAPDVSPLQKSEVESNLELITSKQITTPNSKDQKMSNAPENFPVTETDINKLPRRNKSIRDLSCSSDGDLKSFVKIPEKYLTDIQNSYCINRSSGNITSRHKDVPTSHSSSSNPVLKEVHNVNYNRKNTTRKNVNSKLEGENFSDHSSSYSEVVKVSRTLSSRSGSTVISEVSEVHTLSSQSVKYNSSSLHNRIRNEIQHLNRLEENITSVIGNTRNSSPKVKEPNSHQFLRKEDKLNYSFDVQSVNSSNSCSVDRHTNDVSACDLLENKKEFRSGLLDVCYGGSFNISTFSLEMLNDLLKDEDLKAEHHAALIKLREKTLIDRAKTEIAYLEMQKKELKEQGRDEEIRNIKKKQRGVVVRVDEELQEIQRIRKAEKNASRERRMLIQQQQQLLLQMRNKSLKKSPSSSRSPRSSTNKLSNISLDNSINITFERGSGMTSYLERKTKELQEKENAIIARKKNIESIVAWKQRLDQEEKKVQEMEKLIALAPSKSPELKHATDRGTSPMRFTLDSKDHLSAGEISENLMQESERHHHLTPASQSESENQIKEYNSDSFEQSSVISDQLLTNVTTRNGQKSILENKRKKSIADLKVPLSPRVTILKRRHSSGSDDSILFSQNETLSEQSDMEIRVIALQQQLKMRKAELEKLRKEYHKSQRERLKAKEQSLISQIQAYDTYIEQVKNELQKDCDKSEIKVMRPQIKQPKFSERRKSEIFSAFQEKKKEDLVSDSSSIEHSLSPTNKTSLFIEPVSENIEHDSSETVDSIKTQLESRVFDTSETSASKVLELTLKSSDSKEKVVSSGENYAEPQVNSGGTLPESILEEELEIKSTESEIVEEIAAITTESLSENISKTQTAESEAPSVHKEQEKSLNFKLEISHNSTEKSIPSDFEVETAGKDSRSSSEISRSSSTGKPISLKIKSQAADKQSKSSNNVSTNDETQEVSEHMKNSAELSVDRSAISTNTTLANQSSEVAEENGYNLNREVFEIVVPKIELNSAEDVISNISEEINSQNIESEKVKQSYTSEVLTENKLEPVEEEIEYENATPEESIEDHSLNVSEMVSEIKEQLETISKILNEDHQFISVEPSDLHSEEITKSQKSVEEISENFNEYTSEEPISVQINNKSSSLREVFVEENLKNSSKEKVSLDLNISNRAHLNISEESYSSHHENLSTKNDLPKEQILEMSPTGSESTLKTPTEECENLEESEALSFEESKQENKNFSEYNSIIKLNEEDYTDEKSPIKSIYAEIKENTQIEVVESEVESVEVINEFDDGVSSIHEIQEELELYANTESSCEVANERKAKILDLLRDSFEMSDKLWKENLENFKNEETPLLTALQMERQKNLNIDYIWRDIYDRCENEAIDAFISAFVRKKNALASQDFYKDSEELVESEKVVDNEGFWLGERLTLQTAREAEQLRLQQLQIEQEIEELEQAQEAVSYYYVREIPNKPPPPYTPPGRVAPTQEETLNRISEAAAMLWDVEQSGGDVANFTVPTNYLPSPNDQPHRLFLFELAKELYLKAKPPLVQPVPPVWILSHRQNRRLPQIRSKEDLLKHVERQAKLVFGYEPRVMRENMIMKWSRKKRDQVDEILIRECQEEEQEWIDFSYEENIVKNQLADIIIDQVIESAVSGLSLAFTKKFKDGNIS